LVTPGPTFVPTDILLAGARESIHHRSNDMKEIMDGINYSLPEFFGTENEVYTMLSSGTGAMESAVFNCFNKGDKVLVINNGYFGKRFKDIASYANLEILTVDIEWGQPFELEEIKEIYYNNKDLQGILIVYSETSTGAVNNIKEVGSFFGRTNVLTVVDAISGLISHEMQMDRWGLDVVIASSHKGFMMPPGLSFVCISDKAWEKIYDTEENTYYFSYKRFKDFYPYPPSSPGISLIFSLEKSIELLKAEGIETIYERHRLLARATQNALISLGFELFISDPIRRSNTVTSALSPKGIDTSDLLERINNDYGLTITGGQGSYKGKMIRIGHIGAFDELDLFSVFGAIEMYLNKSKYEFEEGVSTKALINTLRKETEINA
jgi:aspartate aminotransferase-like enzyme